MQNDQETIQKFVQQHAELTHAIGRLSASLCGGRLGLAILALRSAAEALECQFRRTATTAESQFFDDLSRIMRECGESATANILTRDMSPAASRGGEA